MSLFEETFACEVSIGNIQREQVEQTMELGDWDTIEHSDDDWMDELAESFVESGYEMED